MRNESVKEKNIKTKNIEWIFCLGAFVLSALLLLLIFAKQGISPFGDNTMMVWDMDIQYGSFFTWYSNVLHGREDFLYTLRGSLGTNTAGMIAYYLASPLNLLLYFFDNSTMPYGALLLLLLKTGLSASSMQFYLKSKRQDIFTVLFGVAYSLSSFALCFQFNIMWMDAYLLLPLIIYGLDRILSDGRGLLYAVTLGICIFCNFYTAFMVCLFCVFYFVVKLATEKIRKADHQYSRQVRTFILSSAFGGGLSAAVVLPGALGLGASSGERVLSFREFLDFGLMVNPIKELKYLFAGSFDSNQGIIGKYPMLYAGGFTVALMLVFFLSKNVEKYRKISNGMLLIILWIGMFLKGPFALWHGFSYPKGCYERFAFIWIFLSLALAFEAVSSVKEENRSAIVIAMIIPLVILAAESVLSSFRMANVINAFLIFAVTGLIFLYNSSNRKVLQQIASISLMLLVFAELFYNGYKLHEVQFSEMYGSMEKYRADIADFETLSNDENDTESEVNRSVIFDVLGNSYNKGFLYNINGINMYTSTEDLNEWKIYQRLGLGIPKDKNESVIDRQASYLVFGLLGVNRIYDWYFNEPAGFVMKDTCNDVSLFEGESLPLGFLVNEQAIDIESTENYFERLNRVYSSLLGADEVTPYQIVGTDEVGLNRFADYELEKGSRIYRLADEGLYTDGQNLATEDVELIRETFETCAGFTKEIKVEDTSITGRFDNPSTTEAYACFSIPYENNWTVTVDGKETEAVSGMGGLMLVPVGTGEHEIVMDYQVPGLAIGIMISIISFILLLFMNNMDRRKYEEQI